MTASAAGLWDRLLGLGSDEDPGPLLRDLSQLPDAEEVVKSSITYEHRVKGLEALTHPQAAQLASRLLPFLVYLASTAHRDVLLVRRVIGVIPKGELEERIWPLARAHLSTEAWEEPRRFAELFTELDLREPLEHLLETISGSENVDWQEVEEEFKAILKYQDWIGQAEEVDRD